MATSLSDWDKPTQYERWYSSSLGRAYAASVERIVRPWLVELGNARIADVGCGPALTLERLLPPDATVVGVDCSLAMAGRAMVRGRQTGRPNFVAVGSVKSLPFRDASIDAVLCVNCLEFVDDRAAAFREIARVLRRSGQAILGVLNVRSVWELSRRLRRPFTRRSYYQGRFFRKDELCAACAAVGLRPEEVRTAVHFPPVRPGPLVGLVDRLDARQQARGDRSGAVILCRCRKM